MCNKNEIDSFYPMSYDKSHWRNLVTEISSGF